MSTWNANAPPENGVAGRDTLTARFAVSYGGSEAATALSAFL
jgi:hypothetical protein